MTKQFFFLLIQVCIAGQLFGQKSQSNLSFILKGQFINCPEEYLILSYKTRLGAVISDTLHIEADGRFYLKTKKLTEPCVASLQKNTTQINNFFVAPGYELNITGNAESYISLFKSKVISGIGSESNAYRFKLDSILAASADTTMWFDLDDQSLLKYVNQEKRIQDSLAKITFNRISPIDKFLRYFERMVFLDSYFQRMYKLLTHVNINDYSQEKSHSYIYNNLDSRMLNNLYKEEFMLSSYYREFIILKEWPAFLIKVDKKNSDTATPSPQLLDKVYSDYPNGVVKDFALYTLISGKIYFAKSFTDLNAYKSEFRAYSPAIKTRQYHIDINKQFSAKETELEATQVGKPAPVFTLQSSDGDSYRLEDFKGKVVYIDLWASWCEPCRAEIPDFKELYEKFKTDERIVFIGIAVNDGHKEWKNALEKDKPTWLQLIDKDNVVWNAYVANSIPRYVIIDKNGNIANLNAPRPGAKSEIEKELLGEMLK